MVWDLITAKKIPFLPLSKTGGTAMCLAWHTKRICNPGLCPQEVDHVEYSVEEYAILCTWFNEHYLKDG